MQTFGLRVWQAEPKQMELPHIHVEMELNLMRSGRMVYLFGGRRVQVEAGQLAVFWASIPHQLLEVTDGTYAAWATIPLATVLSWNLPEALEQSLLRGEVWLSDDGASGALDWNRFLEWKADLEAPDHKPQREHIVLLGLEARMRRLALMAPERDGESSAASSAAPAPAPTSHEAGRVERMAAFMARHYAQSIAMEDVARAAGIHPRYASTLFRQEFGLTPWEFLTRYRLAHAQRLLVSGEENVARVGELCGFGSPARFHAVFKTAFGQSPAAYRLQMRREANA